jgi:hypothetical protein
VTISTNTHNSLTVELKPQDTDIAPIKEYTVYYKAEYGEWESVKVDSKKSTIQVENLYCGTPYKVYATAQNTIGISESSETLHTKTSGSEALAPEMSGFIQVSSTRATLDMRTWQDGGCHISHFVIEYKKRLAADDFFNCFELY